MSTTTTATRDAEAPFHASAHKADVVLQTQDNVRFYVVKSILAYASPFFENLFSDASSAELVDGLLLVRLHDDSIPLQKMLQLFYPCSDRPEFTAAEEIAEVHAIAEKYCMAELIRPAMERTGVSSPNFPGHPILLYCIAVRLRLPDLVRHAARKCLSVSRESLFAEDDASKHFQYLNGADITGLLKYHQNCGEALVRALDKENKDSDGVWGRLDVAHPWTFGWDTLKLHCPNVNDPNSRHTLPDGRMTHPWFATYLNSLPELLRPQPCLESAGHLTALNTLISYAQTCSLCRGLLLLKLKNWKRVMHEVFDKAISKVRSNYLGFANPLNIFRF